MLARNHETTETGVESTLKDYVAAAKNLFPAVGLFGSFPPLAFHMMLTFYVLLIIVAMVKGAGGQCPSLMAFILLWHFCAIPALFLRSISLKLCRTPLGMLLCFTALLLLILLLQKPLSIAFLNIGKWVKDAISSI
jgi:hypothetical protein